MNRTLERILPKVQKPARYTGGEYNAVVKDRAQVDTRYALCFPDTYEIGMSNLGVRILYGAMNQVEGLWCERAFAPWGDMEEEMRREGIQLYGLESGDPLCDFDIIGFSLGYEMAYTNVLNMLDLAGLPLRSEERRDLAPLVVAGGAAPITRNPWPPLWTSSCWGRGRRSPWSTSPSTAGPGRGLDQGGDAPGGGPHPGHLCALFYEPVYRPDGTLEEMRIREGSGAPELVRKPGGGGYEQVLFPGEDHHPLYRDRPRPGDAGTVPGLYPGAAGSVRPDTCTARCAAGTPNSSQSMERRPVRTPAIRR